MDIIKLQEAIDGVKDSRRQYGNIRHKFFDILVISLFTNLAGSTQFVDMESLKF